jgi:hypothetical protein
MLGMDFAPGQSNVYGDRVLSLGDIISNPDLSFWQMNANLRQNWQAMAIRSFGTALVFKGAKRLLRVPINNVNRNIFGALKMGFKL